MIRQHKKYPQIIVRPSYSRIYASLPSVRPSFP